MVVWRIEKHNKPFRNNSATKIGRIFRLFHHWVYDEKTNISAVLLLKFCIFFSNVLLIFLLLLFLRLKKPYDSFVLKRKKLWACFWILSTSQKIIFLKSRFFSHLDHLKTETQREKKERDRSLKKGINKEIR